MKFSIHRLLVGTVFAVAALGAQAQESTNKVANNTDWYVFEETSPTKQCWAVSKPKETVNTDSAGRIKSVTRSEILLFVSYALSNGVKGQVSFLGGYPFASGSEVKLEIGSSEFALFVDNETAWALTPEDDARIVAAMKRGATAVLTGRSARGTITKDTFSLLGFTASVDEAGKRCSA
ncbi:hypothetical protein EDD53_2691 [Pacificibacter maritimus]|uniref:Invasion protein IalB n=1 Tax=Pacificibacter maritimus TaxID=762213 RepID=A0A3N4UQX7_9RHOB|nr:invasion associated locus B family protein [Pacificibacter maritimus]RPE63094.1 hypothetical protein EDD53_2691 [Pacificibacter maritimus]